MHSGFDYKVGSDTCVVMAEADIFDSIKRKRFRVSLNNTYNIVEKFIKCIINYKAVSFQC